MGLKGLRKSSAYLPIIPRESSFLSSERRRLFDPEINTLIQEIVNANPDKGASQLASIVLKVAMERNVDTGMQREGLTGKIRPLLKKKP